MATFTEQRILKQVSVLSAQNAVQVQWANQVLKDGELLSESYERKAYIAEQAAEFAAEVEGSASYMSILGWTVPPVSTTTP